MAKAKQRARAGRTAGTAKKKATRKRASAPRARAAQAPAPAPAPPAAAGDDSVGHYVYCIIQTGEPQAFRVRGIGSGSAAYTVHYKDMAAVVSDVPIAPLDSTRENVLAHEHVNESVMRRHTVLPMSFGTIFRTHDDIVELLRTAHDAFADVLAKLRNKVEFGIKVLWDRDEIVRTIEDEDEGIHRLREEIQAQKGSTYFARMQYGRLIDAALQERSEVYATELMATLRDVSVASRINKTIGERMILNAAFLVDRDREPDFDRRLKLVANRFDGLTFRYTGPWPPYNFVKLRLKLERVGGR